MVVGFTMIFIPWDRIRNKITLNKKQIQIYDIPWNPGWFIGIFIIPYEISPHISLGFNKSQLQPSSHLTTTRPAFCRGANPNASLQHLLRSPNVNLFFLSRGEKNDLNIVEKWGLKTNKKLDGPSKKRDREKPVKLKFNEWILKI